MALYLLHTNKGIFQIFGSTAAECKTEAKKVLGSTTQFIRSERVSEREAFSQLAGVILPMEGVPMACMRLTGEAVAERRAEISAAEFSIPDAARAVEMSQAFFTFPDVPAVNFDRIAELSFMQFSIPDAPHGIQFSWAQLSIPDAPSTGNVWRPTYIAGNNTANQTALRNAISSAQPGDTILLPENSTWVGNFTLPQKTNVPQYITIRTDIPLSEYPTAGRRVPRSAFPRMARILGSGSATGTVETISTAAASNPAVQYWKFQYVEIGPPDLSFGSGVTRACIIIGNNDTTQTTLDTVPHHFIFDRCWIHGDEFAGVHRAFYLNCGLFDLRDSVCDYVKTVQPDGQVIGGVNGVGPIYITNTELAGGTEVMLLGGDSHKIPNANFTDIQIRQSWLHHYMELRDAPAIPTMPTVTLTQVSGGTVPAGTHTFRVSGRGTVAGGVVQGAAHAEVSITLSAPASIRLDWSPLQPATRISYRVWKRNTDGTWRYYSTAAGASSYTLTADTGGTSGSAPPNSGGGWALKNIFETKSGIDYLIEGCLLENMWVSGQSGQAFAIKSSDYRSCTECKERTENVYVRYCVARHCAQATVMVAAEGTASTMALGDTNNILTNVNFEHVLFYDLNNNYGSSNYSHTTGGSTRSNQVSRGVNGLRYDHCTVIHFGISGGVDVPGSGGIMKFYDYNSSVGTYDTIGPDYPFVYTNNLCMKGTYGFFGSNVSQGNNALASYAPGGIVRRNVIAGGSASTYPTDNLYPTQTEFEAAFRNFLRRDPNDQGNYALRAGHAWATTYLGTDNLPIGADIAGIRARFSPDDLDKIANLQP